MKRPVLLAILTTFAALAVLGVGGLGCQTYDFQRVSLSTLSQVEESFPLTPLLKPNLWLLVDRSGSMTSPDACSSSGPCATTRWEALRSAMVTFLNNAGNVARMGLTFFPAASGGCDQANEVAVELPPPTLDDVGHDQALKDTAALINSKIAEVTPGGGTPTGASVAYVGGRPGLIDPDDGRADFILLLTDGRPNCNANNLYGICGCAAGLNNSPPNTCTKEQNDRCRCTNDNGRCDTVATCNGCLDKDATAAQIATLKKNGIRTIVLAFGPNLATGDAAETLAAMATAGGANMRTCTSDSDCGADDTCTLPSTSQEGLCRRQFYKAANATELTQVLDAIAGKLRPEPCTFELKQGRPDNEKTMAVLFNSQVLRPGPDSWTYSGNNVVFAPTSSYCADIKARKAGLTLSVRYISTL